MMRLFDLYTTLVAVLTSLTLGVCRNDANTTALPAARLTARPSGANELTAVQISAADTASGVEVGDTGIAPTITLTGLTGMTMGHDRVGHSPRVTDRRGGTRRFEHRTSTAARHDLYVTGLGEPTALEQERRRDVAARSECKKATIIARRPVRAQNGNPSCGQFGSTPSPVDTVDTNAFSGNA